MDITKLVRIQDSGSPKDLLSSVKETDIKKLVNSFDVKEIPVNLIKGSYPTEPKSSYQTVSVKVGDYTIYVKCALMAYLNEETGKVEIDVDDLSGKVTTSDGDVTDRDAVFDILGKVQNILEKSLTNDLAKALKRSKEYKKYNPKVSDSFESVFDFENAETFEELLEKFERSFKSLEPKVMGDRLVIPSAGFIEKVCRLARDLGCEVSESDNFTVITAPGRVHDDDLFLNELKSMIGATEKKEAHGNIAGADVFVEATYLPRTNEYTLWIAEASKDGNVKNYEVVVENEEDLSRFIRKIEYDFYE